LALDALERAHTLVVVVVMMVMMVEQQVLLVEDNKSTLMIMSRLLRQKLNYNVVVASSVADALRVADAEGGEFDLVISDIGLPDGTGLQLMTTLKAKYNLKVRQSCVCRVCRVCVVCVCGVCQRCVAVVQGIALSGYGMDEDVRRSADAGFELHLTKPVHFSSLSAAIDALYHHQLPEPSLPPPSPSPSPSPSPTPPTSPSPSSTTSPSPSPSSPSPSSPSAPRSPPSSRPSAD
jgi:CheY-like chemotaxis protein